MRLNKGTVSIADTPINIYLKLMTTDKLEKNIKIKNGKDYKHLRKGCYPVYGGNGVLDYVSDYNSENCIVVGRVGVNCGNVFIESNKCWVSDNALSLTTNPNIKLKYLYYQLQNYNLNRLKKQGSQPLITKTILNNLKFCIPSSKTQNTIIKILDNFTELIDTLKAELTLREKQFNFYLSFLFSNLNNKDELDLKRIVTLNRGKQINKKDITVNGKYQYINGGIEPSGNTNKYNFEKNKIIISEGGASAGFVNFIQDNFWGGSDCFVIENKSNEYLNRFIYYFLKNNQEKLMNQKHGAGIPHLSRFVILNLKIPVVNLNKQEEIVNNLDNLNNLINLLKQEIDLRQKQYEYYRDKLLDFGDEDE